MMVGDGVNDGAALSSASVGIAMGDGTVLARAVANVLLVKPNLEGLVSMRHLSVMSVARIRLNFLAAIGLNSVYLAGALFAGFSPALCAALHNLTTPGIAVNAIRPYKWEESMPFRHKLGRANCQQNGRIDHDYAQRDSWGYGFIKNKRAKRDGRQGFHDSKD